MLGPLTPEENRLVEHVTSRFNQADQGLHQQLRKRWDHLDGLFNNYSDLKRSWTEAAPRDRDSVMRDGQQAFGYELFIPHTYATVELTVARTLAHRPRIIPLPCDRESEPNVDNVRWLLADQLGKIDYELVLQSVGKCGHIYNLGVQKTYARKEERDASKLELVQGKWLKGNARPMTIFDGPMAEAITPYDFLWDPHGSAVDRLAYAFHRTWRPTSYVLERLGLRPEREAEAATWPALHGRLTVKDVEGAGRRSDWSELWAGRSRSLGFPAPAQEAEGESIHEIWEFHDGNQVIVILDRQWPVAVAENPSWTGALPFQVYRPTEVPGRLMGKGTVEPMEDLQHEVNLLRTDRRWNALTVLHQPLAVNSDLLDPDDVRIGPMSITPVQGDPRGAIFPLLPERDIPASSYREVEEMVNDIQRVSGLADPTESAGAVSATATGVQMVQQATQVRTKMTTRRIAVEVVKPTARRFHELNQQRDDIARDIRVPSAPTPERAEPYAWAKIDPATIAGNFDFEVEDLSTSAEDISQRRNDARMYFELSNSPHAEQRKMLLLALRNLDLAHPEEYLSPERQMADPDAAYKALTDLGVPDEIAQTAIRAALPKEAAA